MLKASHIKKSFHSAGTDIVVLKDVSFSVEDGEFISVIGRSGSGKSTLLYQLSLLDRPTSGTIMLDNKNVNDLSDEHRTNLRLTTLGYIFQDYALIPTLTAQENILIPLLMQGKSFSAGRKMALDALDRVGIAEKAGNLPSQLSGGQQQRVSIARAIAHFPKVIFADEPTANLDNESSEVIIDLFEKLNKEGQTIVMVTHEPEYAQRTHRIITLFDGEITSIQKTKRKNKNLRHFF